MVSISSGGHSEAVIKHSIATTGDKRNYTIEYLSLLAIIFIIVKWGFIAGVLIGTVIGCATFALSASRISSIKFGLNPKCQRTPPHPGGRYTLNK